MIDPRAVDRLQIGDDTKIIWGKLKLYKLAPEWWHARQVQQTKPPSTNKWHAATWNISCFLDFSSSGKSIKVKASMFDGQKHGPPVDLPSG